MVSKIFRAFNSNLEKDEKVMNVSVFLNWVARVPTTWKTAKWIVVMSSDNSWLMLEMQGCSFFGGGSHVQNTEVPDGTIVCSTRQIARKILPERTKIFFLDRTSRIFIPMLLYQRRIRSAWRTLARKQWHRSEHVFLEPPREKKIKTSNKLHQIAH